MPLFLAAWDGNLALFYGFLAAFIGAYVAVAGLSYLYLYVIKPTAIAGLKIQPRMPTRQEVLREIGWSILTLLVWAIMALVLISFIDRGLTQMYFDIGLYGILYFLLSILILIITHDAYFYWVHRWMHDSDFAYNYIHNIHHESENPTPFAIFSFGPIEAVIMGLYIYLAVFLLPVHIYALVALFVFDTVLNVMGHMGYEMVPARVAQTPVGRAFNSTINHDLHHSRQRSNYGLYFIFWDKIMNTANPDNEKAWRDFHSRTNINAQ